MILITRISQNLNYPTRTNRVTRTPTPNWDDLVRTFMGNFQGTYVRPGKSWDLRSCT
jgi:hypothetical protein